MLSSGMFGDLEIHLMVLGQLLQGKSLHNN